MSKKTPWILLAVLTVGFASIAQVAAHPPEEHETDETPTRRLSIIAVAPPEEQPYEERKPYEDMLLDLSDDASQSSEPNKTYVFGYNMLSSCQPYYLPYPTCYSQQYASDELANLGEDFEIAPSSILAGNLHFSYDYSRGGISSLQQEPVIGHIHVGLLIGDDWYSAEPITLGPKGGEFNVPVTFHWYPSCEYDYENDTETCQDEKDDAPENSTEEVWGHDLRMFIDIEGPYQYSLVTPATSQRLDVMLDTAGGSYVDVPEIVPAPAAAGLDTSMVSVGHDDLDEDGVVAEPVPIYAEEGEDGTLYYAPGPGIPLFLAAALGLAYLVRRRIVG